MIIVKYFTCTLCFVTVKELLRLHTATTDGIVKSPEAPPFGRVGAVFQGNKQTYKLSLLLHRASCIFTNYHTANKCTNCMSFIFKSLF